MQNIYTDVLIIGAGPIGLFAATSCCMHMLKVHVVDCMDKPGGQCTALYPDKLIYDIPGIPEIKSDNLIYALLKQMSRFNVQIDCNTTITSIAISSSQTATPLKYLQHSHTHSSDINWEDVHSSSKHSSDINWKDLMKSNASASDELFPIKAHSADKLFHAKYIIIATGTGGFEANKLIMPNTSTFIPEQYADINIFYTLPSYYADKIITILGGGDTALDYAMHMSTQAKHVHIIHRRANFSALPYTINQILTQGNITLHTSISVADIHPIKQQLQLTLSDYTTLTTDYLIPCYGLKKSQMLLHTALLIQDGMIVIDPENCQTSLTNVYCVGDASYYTNKAKLFSIAHGFGQVAKLF